MNKPSIAEEMKKSVTLFEQLREKIDEETCRKMDDRKGRKIWKFLQKKGGFSSFTLTNGPYTSLMAKWLHNNMDKEDIRTIAVVGMAALFFNRELCIQIYGDDKYISLLGEKYNRVFEDLFPILPQKPFITWMNTQSRMKLLDVKLEETTLENILVPPPPLKPVQNKPVPPPTQIPRQKLSRLERRRQMAAARALTIDKQRAETKRKTPYRPPQQITRPQGGMRISNTKERSMFNNVIPNSNSGFRSLAQLQRDFKG